MAVLLILQGYLSSELPKLDTALPAKKKDAEIPQSCSNEATPRAEAYEDRNVALERAALSRIREASVAAAHGHSPRSASESDDAE